MDTYPASPSMRSSSRTLAGRSSTIKTLALRISAASSMWLPGLERRVQSLHELLDLDRLGEIREESRLEALLDIAWHRIGAEGDDGDVRGRRIVAQDLQGVDTADPGQIDVHEDHVRLMSVRQLDAHIAIHRGQQAQGGAARDQLLDQLQVRGVVLDVEQRAHRLSMVRLRAGGG